MFTFKYMKYTLATMKKTLTIFYSIYFLTCIFLLILDSTLTNSNVNLGSTEMPSLIFLFIAGLNFKEEFYFLQNTGYTRKKYLINAIISFVPICLIMVTIDIILLFTLGKISSDFYIMSSFKELFIGLENTPALINYIVPNILFSLTLYFLAFILGHLISLIYYKSNKLIKVIISLAPFFAISIIASEDRLFRWIKQLFKYYFGQKNGPNNPYLASLNLFLTILLICCLKKA